MDNKEILEKAKLEPKVDEREKSLLQKANIIAAIVMAVLVICFVFVTGALEIRPAYFALLASVFAYCGAYYISQYVLFNKKTGVLVGGIAWTISCLAMTALFIVSIVLGW